MRKRKKWKKVTALVLAAAVILGSSPVMPQFRMEAEAKTQNSTPAQNVFFYAKNDEGKSVLMKIASIEELEALSHGKTQASGTEENYCYSATDNYPTTQYCEARGFTVPELVEYVKQTSTVKGAESLTYQGDDLMRFMATDGYGTYTHSWTYDDLYGEKRYYFEGLYDENTGWNTGWEIAGENNSKFGVDLDTYNEQYRDSDPYYDAKRSVFAGGEETEAILATESFSGRTTSASLTASTEKGLAGYISANGGTVKGCLKDALTGSEALRLCIPTTEADLMAAHRTAYDNFKWVYTLELDMAGSGGPVSLGTVAEPEASFSVSEDKKTLSVTLSCSTPGAEIYYSFTDAPQTLYEGTVTYDISGRDLESNPVTVYVTAVREGYDDAGQITLKYPESGVRFKTLYSTMTGADAVFEADDSVTDAEWNEWTSSIIGISAKTPSISGYAALDDSQYDIDRAGKKITIDKSVFTETGSYSFMFYAKNYANKSVSISVKKAAPGITVQSAQIGADITAEFSDENYQSGLYLYVTEPGGSEPSMISAGYLDRTQAGKVILKSSYFDSSSCLITEPGSYIFEFVNNSYSPSSQTVTVQIGDGTQQPGSSGFKDVTAGSWYYEAVEYVTGKGYFSGTSADTFSPDSSMTRGMFVTVLGRMAGADVSQYGGSSFSDVEEGQYYCPYVNWAAENGIVSGVGGGCFSPDGRITREQMASIMYNYVKFTRADMTASDVRFNSFPDGDSVSSWAEEAMIWASDKEIINGSDGRLNPSGSATRAQVAQIVMNFCQKFTEA